MAANIEIRNGVASFVENSREEVAWHGLGQRFDHPLTVKEAIAECHADFNVGLQPVAALTPQMIQDISFGKMIDPQALKDCIINGRMATMRLDYNEPFAVVSDTYGIVQNQDAFNFIDLLTNGELEGETPTIESAGLLGNGERVFITAKFPEPIRLAKKDDIVDMYVVFTTSHNGMGAVTCMVTPIRVVCNNTLNLALRENSGKISFKHTRYVNNRLDLTNKENATMAYKSLNLYQTYKVFFEEKLALLAKKNVSDEEVKDIIAKITLPAESYDIFKKTGNVFHEDISTRAKNIYSGILNSLESGVGQEYGDKGTALWLINGITTHYQNTEKWDGKGLKKFDSIMEGTVQKRVQDAYELLSA